MLVLACSCTSSPLGLTVNIRFKDTPTCLYEYTSYVGERVGKGECVVNTDTGPPRLDAMLRRLMNQHYAPRPCGKSVWA